MRDTEVREALASLRRTIEVGPRYDGSDVLHWLTKIEGLAKDLDGVQASFGSMRADVAAYVRDRKGNEQKARHMLLLGFGSFRASVDRALWERQPQEQRSERPLAQGRAWLGK